MDNNLLKSLGINSAQEKALREVCDRIWTYQLETGETIMAFIDSDQDISVTHPFYDTTGRFKANPIEEYGDEFKESIFVTFAKELPLKEDSKEEEIAQVVKDEIDKIYKLEKERIKGRHKEKAEEDIKDLERNFNL